MDSSLVGPSPKWTLSLHGFLLSYGLLFLFGLLIYMDSSLMDSSIMDSSSK